MIAEDIWDMQFSMNICVENTSCIKLSSLFSYMKLSLVKEAIVCFCFDTVYPECLDFYVMKCFSET